MANCSVANAASALKPQAPAVFSQDRLQRCFVQAEVSHQMFQPPVLIFQTSQPLRFAHFHPAVLALPTIQRGFAHTVLAGQFCHLPPRLVLFQTLRCWRSLESPGEMIIDKIWLAFVCFTYDLLPKLGDRS